MSKGDMIMKKVLAIVLVALFFTSNHEFLPRKKIHTVL